MKTFEKCYFVCETCGRTSLNKDKILECQMNHRRVTDDCQVECLFNKGGIFPHEIDIAWPDGASGQYVLTRAKNAPEKPETEKE